MSLELLAIGEYRGVKIFIKRGSCLKEFPYYYENSFSNPCVLNFALYSSIYPALDMSEGLAGEIMKIEDTNLAEKVAERGTKRPKIGELICVATYLTHWDCVVFVVLDELMNPTIDDRQDITEYMKFGLDLIEEKGVSSIVMPGHAVVFKIFECSVAAEMHLEAIEMFLDGKTTENVKSIYLCVESEEQLQAYLTAASEKFQNYSMWIFMKNNNMPL